MFMNFGSEIVKWTIDGSITHQRVEIIAEEKVGSNFTIYSIQRIILIYEIPG